MPSPPAPGLPAATPHRLAVAALRSTPLLPSFDCAEAQTFIEHAICGDPHLARLDREVSDEYVRQTMNDADKAYIARTKAEQRAWLEERAHDCDAAPRVVACLAAASEARMKVLLPGP